MTKRSSKQMSLSVLAIISAIAATGCAQERGQMESNKMDMSSQSSAVLSSQAPNASPMPAARPAPRAQMKASRQAESPMLGEALNCLPPPSADASNEAYGRIIESDFLSVRQNPFSTFSIDVDTAAYANVRRILQSGVLPPEDAVRTEECINYFTYDYPQPKDNNPFSVNIEMSECPWAPGHKLALLGLQGRKIAEENMPPSNLVFLIDVSGSMSDPNKLPLLKQSFALLVEKMRPQDRVSIVTYAGSSGLVLPSTPGSQKRKILDSLDRLESGGGTAGGEGIKLAYDVAAQNFIANGNNRVILATDGDFNVGPSSDGDLEQLIESKRKSGVFLTVLGFGMGNLKDQHMETLADKGNGNHAYIDSALEAKKVLVNEFGGTMLTIAKDVKLQVEFNPNQVKGYRLIGYENRMLAAEDFNDDQKDAGEMGSGHTVSALYEIIPAGAKDKVRDNVDPSRYQKLMWVAGTPTNDEFMCVKLRYKDPKGSESKLIKGIIHTPKTASLNTSNNFRWSAAVAEFSMLLRDSKFKGKSNYSDVLKLAKSAVGNDSNGYRREFIELVNSAQKLDNREHVASNDRMSSEL
jgi:Ca-activated chloride channel homolog